MVKRRKSPKISFIIPTYNAGKQLERCLKSIRKQTYKSYEILIIDGGSKDRTIKISKKYRARVLKNPQVDAESGKSIGIEKSRGEIIALVDADNELVQDNWLQEMIKPLNKHKDLWGVESPWLLNEKDNLVNKYFTLLQVADPVARKFSPVKMKRKEYEDYTVNEPRTKVPIIGANGFLWRKKFITQINKHVPKFEEVNYVSLMMTGGIYKYARHKKVGIYHYYSNSVANYINKRLKIGRKFLKRKSNRQLTWVDKVSFSEFIKSILFNISIIGPGLEAIKEYKKSKEVAWFLHPFFSLLTVLVYIYTTIERLLTINKKWN